MFSKDMKIAGYDDELATAIEEEKVRQEDHIELIASENYASPRVMEAQGSVLTNKYAEGYPGKRWYGGCEEVDRAESRYNKGIGSSCTAIRSNCHSLAVARVSIDWRVDHLIAIEVTPGECGVDSLY